MALTTVEIHAAADALVAKRIVDPTNEEVRAQLGTGSMATIAPAMRRWRLIHGLLHATKDKALESDLGDALLLTVHALRKALGAEADALLEAGEKAIEGKMQRAAQRAEEAETRADAAHRHAQTLQEQLAQALRQVESANDALREETRWRAHAQAEAEQARVQLVPLQGEVTRCNAMLADCQAALRERAAAHDDITGKLVTAESALATVKEQAQRRDGELASLHASLDQQRESLQSLQAQVDEAHREKQTLRAHVLSLEGQAKADGAMHAQSLQALETTTADRARVRGVLDDERRERALEQQRHREEVTALREDARRERETSAEQLRTFSKRLDALGRALAYPTTDKPPSPADGGS